LRDASDSIPGLAYRRIFFTAKNRLGRSLRGRGKLQQLKLEELEEIFDNAFLDRDRAEIIFLSFK